MQHVHRQGLQRGQALLPQRRLQIGQVAQFRPDVGVGIQALRQFADHAPQLGPLPARLGLGRRFGAPATAVHELQPHAPAQFQTELAAEEERQRLAREIHDTLAQGFTSIVMHLEAAEQALPQDEATVQKHLNQARKTARISLEQARRVVADLRPDLLEQQSLPEALARAAARWSEESGVACTLTTTGTAVSLHPDIEITLLRATQEALNNIRKHAQAHAVTITLSYMGDILILDVQDDGIGINNATPTAPSGGFGLKGMRERVQQCGGELLIESEPDEGTTLVVSIPIGEERSME